MSPPTASTGSSPGAGLGGAAQPLGPGLLARLDHASVALLVRPGAGGGGQCALPQTFALERQIRGAGRAPHRARPDRRDPRGRASAGSGACGVTRGAWAVTLLRSLAVLVRGNNLVSLVAWQSAEDTSASWNPLAMTPPVAGAGDFNGVGVKNYDSLLDGIDATVATLRDGWATQGYGWIVYRLSQCSAPTITVQAINASNWCRGCTNGRYVTDTLPFVEDDDQGYAER